MARDDRKVTSVKIWWEGAERATVWNFTNPINWGWDPSIGFNGISWTFFSNGKGNHINLDKARHIEVVYE